MLTLDYTILKSEMVLYVVHEELVEKRWMVQYRERLDAIVAKFMSADVESSGKGPKNATSYRGRLPESVLQLWELIGLGVFLSGYFQLCDPDDYRPILEQALGHDHELDARRTFVIGFSAFGEIIAWNEDFRDVRIDLVDGEVSCRWLVSPKQGIDPNMTVLTRLLLVDDVSFDPLDAEGRPLFEAVRARLGRLEADQIYGFRPILAFGGTRDAGNVATYSSLSHMSLLAQAQDLKLIDMNPFPPKEIRKIGSPAVGVLE